MLDFSFTSNKNNDILTLSAQTIVDDEEIHLNSTDTLPDGLSKNVKYYVVNSTGSTFQLSVTPGGTGIDIVDVGGRDLHGLINLRVSSFHLLDPLPSYRLREWYFSCIFGNLEGCRALQTSQACIVAFHRKGCFQCPKRRVPFIQIRIQHPDIMMLLSD